MRPGQPAVVPRHHRTGGLPSRRGCGRTSGSLMQCARSSRTSSHRPTHTLRRAADTPCELPRRLNRVSPLSGSCGGLPSIARCRLGCARARDAARCRGSAAQGLCRSGWSRLASVDAAHAAGPRVCGASRRRVRPWPARVPRTRARPAARRATPRRRPRRPTSDRAASIARSAATGASGPVAGPAADRAGAGDDVGCRKGRSGLWHGCTLRVGASRSPAAVLNVL